MSRELLSRVADGKRGVTSNQMAWLADNQGLYASLLAYFKDPKSLSEIDRVRIQPLLDKQVDEPSAMVWYELIDAFRATFDYIATADEIGRGQTEKSVIDFSVEANVEFADFFIKIGERFGFRKELRRIFLDIFWDPNMQREFNGLGTGNFPFGVFAVVEAYLDAKVRFPGGCFRAGTFDEDKYHATDMVWMADQNGEKPERIFEVKANGRKMKLKRNLFDLTNLIQVEDLHALNLQFPEAEASRREKSLEHLLDYAKEVGATPFWYEVPWER